MPGSALDDLGIPAALGSAVAPAVPSSPVNLPPAPATGIDPFLIQTAITEAGTDPTAVRNWASVVMNRANASKETPRQVLMDPGQFQYGAQAGSPEHAAINKTLAIQASDPRYQAVLAAAGDIFSGKTPPINDYDHYWSPSAQKAAGRIDASGNPIVPQWAQGQKGDNIGGNLYYKTGYPGPAGAQASALDDLGVPKPYAGDGGVAAPKAPNPKADALAQDAADIADANFKANAASGNPQWPIYDPANNVGRNKDGSIAFVGAPGQPPSVDKTGALNVKLTASTNQDAINEWQRTHPLDPSNRPDPYAGSKFEDPAGGVSGPLGFLGAGENLGLNDVKNSLGSFDATLRSSSPFVNAMMGGPFGNPQGLAMEKAQLGQGVMERNADETSSMASNPWFQGGKFVGEAVPSAAILAGTEGLGGAALGAAGLGDLAASGAEASPWLYRAPGMLASSIGKGAAYGGGGAALTSAGSSAPLSQQVEQGAESGAALNPFADIGAAGAGQLGKFAGGIVKPYLAPFTKAGREGLVNDALSGPTSGDWTQYIEGSRPTYAMATRDGGAAATERTLRSDPHSPEGRAFAALDTANNAARDAALDSVVGTPADLDTLRANRAASTEPLRKTAFANTTPVDPTPVIEKIDEILAGPAGQRDAVFNNLSAIRDKIAKSDGTMQTDPEQLWGIRQSIDDALSPLASNEKGAKLASMELRGVQRSMDPVIDSGAPGYSDYSKAYRAASQPINAQEFLQSPGLFDNMKGNMTLGKVDGAIKRIEKARLAPGFSGPDDISDEQMNTLYNLRSDLRRSDLGDVLGSSGRAKVITGNVESPAANMFQRAVGPASEMLLGGLTGHPLVGAGVAAGNAALQYVRGQGLSRARSMLADRLLNSSEATIPVNKGADLSAVPPTNRFGVGLRTPLLTGAGIAGGAVPPGDNRFMTQ